MLDFTDKDLGYGASYTRKDGLYTVNTPFGKTTSYDRVEALEEAMRMVMNGLREIDNGKA